MIAPKDRFGYKVDRGEKITIQIGGGQKKIGGACGDRLRPFTQDFLEIHAGIFADQAIRVGRIPTAKQSVIRCDSQEICSATTPSSEKKLKTLARRLFQDIEQLPGLGQLASDDGCYERTEGILGALRVYYSIPETLLGRATVVNPYIGEFLWARKSLSRNGKKLEKWFAKVTERQELIPGATFDIEGLQFMVDDFRALRCTLIPTIYFDQRDTAFWGIGHTAPMVGSNILDPTMGRGPMTFKEWREALHLPGLIPLIGSPRGLPELASEFLDQRGQDHVYKSLDSVSFRQNILGKDIKTSVAQMNDREKSEFYDLLFAEQIRDGGVLTRSKWSELFLGVLTIRGENYGQFDSVLRKKIDSELQTDWQVRLETSLKVLHPFAAFQKLILGAPYEWHAPLK